MLKKHRTSRLLIRIFLLILMLLLIAGLYLLSRLDNIQNHALKNVAVNEIKDDNINDYTNIAIYGVDSRANDLKKNTRSDSIIVASIHKKTHNVILTSIYRDTYVRIEDHGFDKINHAYAFGGPDLAVNTINTNFDLNIQDFITVNFSALSNVIDGLGGITLNIHKDELKWVNAYARDVAKINGMEFTKIKKPGKQTVSGVQATGYCRVRYTAGGDFTRAKRQRKVLEAIFAKAKKTNPVTLLRVMDDVLPQIYTSMTTSDILNMAVYLPFYNITSQKGFPYDMDCHRASNGIYYDFPTTLSSNVTKLHKKLFGTKDYKPSETVLEINRAMGYE
ncbi:MAG: LCP family protein [Lachnospiraceae bacterium]|nr:LCP family protein [Lachnospiraceae bacterium]